MQEHYELLFIIAGSRDETEVPTIKQKVVDLITKREGQITLDENWERRKLAYKIKQEISGHYWLMQFDMEKDKAQELSGQLQLMPEILRFLLIKTKVQTTKELEEDEKIQEKIRARKADAVKKEIVEDEKKQVEDKKPKVKEASKKDEGKISMEDLDKKLDEILGDDIEV